MAKNLVVVESPAKAKTLNKYLGPDFGILASYGHVRDLVPKEGAVDPEHDFAMRYQIIDKNSKHVDAICQALREADTLYLATDPDREGEAISWHLFELLEQRGVLKNKNVYRVAFYEITKTAVQAAVANPRGLSMELVHAQQARRALDFLVGFNLSPLLWKKVRRGLSAGRVQSPALRMIVERELEIEAFKAEEYWTMEADLLAKEKVFDAKLVEYNNEKLKQFSITNAKQAKEIEQVLLENSKGKLVVAKVTKTQRKRNPTAPFTTSTLQQEAVRKLGFTAQRAMRVAQQLYEGIDIGDGAVGLITYMRTDSVNLADEAVKEIREFIAERYGADNVPEEARKYKTKAKNAQEAHEAIRPTMVRIVPNDIKTKLSADQFKLYNLIWKRTIACQMVHATIDQVAIDYNCGEGNRFRSNGATIASPGFMQVYQEGIDDGKLDDDDENLLPSLKVGDIVDLTKIRPEQHFTEPPPRYSEASLVKSLEEHGIGRPSTYAAIISTLQHREYALLDNKRFKPTDVGRIVTKFLTTYFTQYVDYGFTAKLEDSLDGVAAGEKEWLPVLQDFWTPFIKLVHNIEETVQRKDVTQEELDEVCPECGSKLSIWLGKRGRFIGCTGYPNCKYTRNLKNDNEPEIPAEVLEGRKCPNCQSDLVIKAGKYGKFIGCSGYPNCKFIESLDKPVDTGVECPECKKGHLMKRKTRYGTFFYACNVYPDCKYAVKYPPLAEACPKCSWPILTIRTTKRRGTEKACPQKTCDFVEPYEDESESEQSEAL
jgi:DNA topoisomerase-1